jgi:hypothetical protein
MNKRIIFSAKPYALGLINAGRLMNTYSKPALLICIISILCFCNGNGSPKIEIISVQHASDLSKLKPAVDFEKIFLSHYYANKIWDTDDIGNYYFIDIYKHRVLKFDKDRKFLIQIGGIGQEDDSLYYPNGVFVYKGTLFVLDQEGKKVKQFSLDGSYLSSFEIKDAFSSESFFISNDQIFLSVKYRSRKGYNANRLVSRFSLNGEKLGDFGNVVESVKYAGYISFNRVYLTGKDSRLFASHTYLPLVRIFEDGREIKKINLLDINLKEIDAIDQEGKRRKVDTPGSILKKNAVRSIIYCSSFYPISKTEFYFVANYERHKKSAIFILDENGKCKKRMRFEYGGKPLLIKNIKCKAGVRYCIAANEQKIYLFTF